MMIRKSPVLMEAAESAPTANPRHTTPTAIVMPFVIVEWVSFFIDGRTGERRWKIPGLK
jgi:hypothetical protein